MRWDAVVRKATGGGFSVTMGPAPGRSTGNCHLSSILPGGAFNLRNVRMVPYNRSTAADFRRFLPTNLPQFQISRFCTEEEPGVNNGGLRRVAHGSVGPVIPFHRK